MASALLLMGGALMSGNDIAALAGSAGALFGFAALAVVMMTVRRPAILSVVIRPVGRIVRTGARFMGRSIEDPESLLRATAARMAATQIRVTGWLTVGITAVANWLADMGALAASIAAVGAPVPWRGLMLAYAVGTGAAAIGIVPGGLGIVEATLAVALMEAGVHHPVALAAVLVYRLISFWMVNSIGWLAYLSLGRSGPSVRGVTTGSRRAGVLHRAGDPVLELPVLIGDFQPRQVTGPTGDLREQHVA